MNQPDPAKRGRGRPPADVKMVQVKSWMLPEDAAKLAQLGGSPWVRSKVRKAKLPGGSKA